MKFAVEFDLMGWFPDLIEKYRPKDMPLSTFFKVIVEGWIVNRSLKEEYADHVKDLDFFVMNIDGQNMIFSNEYKDEIKQFIDERRTHPRYCQRLRKRLQKQASLTHPPQRGSQT
jgi:hypothetical protein